MKTCIMCGDSTEGSMDGPYICSRCDCGIRPDGKRFTYSDSSRYYRQIGEWKCGDPDRYMEPLWPTDQPGVRRRQPRTGRGG